MAELLADRLKRWRGGLRQKEAAAKLDIPLPTYRKYENGKRTPNALAMAELCRRMEELTPEKLAQEGHWKARGDQIIAGLNAP